MSGGLRALALRVAVAGCCGVLANCVPEERRDDNGSERQPPTPTPIVPEFYLGLPYPCSQVWDVGADGSVDQTVTLTLDTARRAVRREDNRGANGATDDLYLLQEDGKLHDSEVTGLNTAGPQTYGNVHYLYDDDRVVQQVNEGSDSRMTLAVTDFYYDEAGRVIRSVRASYHPSVESETALFLYDDDGRLVEQSTDAGSDGVVDETVTLSYSDGPDDQQTTTTTTIAAEGTTLEREMADTFGTILRMERDEGADGTLDRLWLAVVEDGRLQGYEDDVGADGEIDGRSEMVWNDAAFAFETRTLDAAGATRWIGNLSFACWHDDIERGACAAPFVETGAFPCARFAAAPALDFARGHPAVGGDSAAMLVTGGYASYPLSVILNASEVLALDATNPTVVRATTAYAQTAAAVLSGGALILAGGLRESAATTRIARVDLDGVTTELAASLSTARYSARAISFADDAVLVVGGSAADVAPVADLIEGTVTTSSDTGVLAKYGASLTRVGGSHALYAGGGDGSAAPMGSSSGALFSRETATWTPVTLGVARTQHAALEVSEGRIVLVGGRDGPTALDAVEVFSLAGSGMAPAAPLPAPRIYPAAALLPDGRVLVAGGGIDVDGVLRAQASTFVYDVDADSWSAGPPLSIPRADATAWVRADGAVVIVGGIIQSGQATSAVEVLEIAE